MGRAASYLRKYTTKNMHQPLHTNKKRDLSTGRDRGSMPSTSFGAFDVGVCISETKHNRKSRVRARWRDTGGRLRERGGTRADVNKPRSGASTALTILGIHGSRLGWDSRNGPRSGERVRRQRGQHKHSVTQDGSAHALRKNEHETSRPTLKSRPVPMQFTSPHPAPDWQCAARASDDLALQRAPSRAAAPAPRPALPTTAPPRPAPAPRRARPTSGESRMSTRRATN